MLKGDILPITSLNQLISRRELYSDDDAIFDRVIELDVSTLEPQVTWGTNPKWCRISVNHSLKMDQYQRSTCV